MTSPKSTGVGGLSWHLLQPHPSAALEVGGAAGISQSRQKAKTSVNGWMDSCQGGNCTYQIPKSISLEQKAFLGTFLENQLCPGLSIFCLIPETAPELQPPETSLNNCSREKLG